MKRVGRSGASGVKCKKRLPLLHPEEIPVFSAAGPARPAVRDFPCTNIYIMTNGVIFRRGKNYRGKTRESRQREKTKHRSVKL